MTTLYRSRTQINTPIGGAGVATMYFLDVETTIEGVHAFWTASKASMPDDVQIIVEPGGDTIEDTTGVITGAWAVEPMTVLTGEASTVYAAPVGCHVGWRTSTILDGRRLQGRTFIVPLAGGNFDTTGTLLDATATDFRNRAISFLADTSGAFVIWHRPREAKPADGSRPAVTARAGGHGVVTSSYVKDVATILKSRRS